MNDMQKTLTPQGIPTTSFADKAIELEALLSEKIVIESDIAEKEMDIRDLLYTYKLPKEVREAPDLMELEDQLTIYFPLEEESLKGLVYIAAKAEGRAFSEIAQNLFLLKALEKQFSPDVIKFIREVDDVFHYKIIEKPQQANEKVTQELKEKYMKLVRELSKLKMQQKASEQRIANVDKYIAFCKNIVALAPAPQKGGDKGQQQGGQRL